MRILASGAVVLTMAGLFALGCNSQREAPSSFTPPLVSRVGRIDRALAAGARYLVAHQSPDGAWRSELKGPFKDGDSLTPLAVLALQQCGPEGAVRGARERGADYLAAMIRPDGSIDPGPRGLSYPVYTASLSVVALSDPSKEPRRAACDAWLKYLRDRQLTEDRGWKQADRPYGGWGYCAVLPRKPPPGEFGPPLLEANLSATRFALQALAAAGCSSDDPALKKALVFLRRCQNYHDEEADRDAAFDDGGFFFIYDDAVRNKAGAAGKDRLGRERFQSYGSTTADGLYALQLCEVSADDARHQAARGWLAMNFSAKSHPGAYASHRERDREAVYYYYAWAAALALRGSRASVLETKTGKVVWSEAVADVLLSRQKDDGSWVNDLEQVREDDPLVATPLAMAALALCSSLPEQTIEVSAHQ